MKRAKFCFISLFVLSSSLAFGQSWLWGAAGQGSEKSNVYGAYTATDKYGDAYASGMYNNSITFGSITISDPSDHSYLVKYNSSGTAQWAYLDTNDQYGPPVATDTEGNPFLTGMTIYAQTYLIKLNSSGTVLWKESPTASGYSQAWAICSDDKSYIYIAGSFTGALTFGLVTLNSGPSPKMFLFKFDYNGNVIWGRQSGPDTTEVAKAYALHADNNGNIYFAGSYAVGDSGHHGNVQLGTYFFPNNRPNSGIVYAKYDANGNLKWALTPKGTYSNVATAIPTSITTDNAGNSYLAGQFTDSIAFNSIVLTNSLPNTAIFVTKFDTSGNPVWAEKAISSVSTISGSLADDAHNNLYLGGYSYGNFSFGGMSWNANSSDFYLMFDTSGHTTCGSTLKYGGALGIATDSSGTYHYLAADSYDSVYAGPDTLVPLHSLSMPFVARWEQCTCSLASAIITPSSAILLYRNGHS